MKEKTLLKLAILCSLVGIVILFLVSENLEIKLTDIDKINNAESGETVKIVGSIESVSDTDNLMFLTIGQEKIETISVLLFKDSNLSLEKGTYVEITGTVEDYEGEKEIIANKVRLI